MASSLPPTPRSSASASRPSPLAPTDQLSAAQSCPSSTIPSPVPSTEASLAASNTAPPSEAGARDEPDATIVEALNGSKDRLFVLKLGEDFDSLLNERGITPGKRCTYTIASSYQRMLVHRCAQYYRLLIEVDGKVITVSIGPESRVPKSRIAEIAPQEKAATPAFKIMRRSADERARAKQPGRSDSTEEDQGDGTAGTDEVKRRPQMTIEERTAAYEQARSRIFEGFQEKEVQPSPPAVRRDSGNAEPRWVDKQRRSDLSSSSRSSPIPQDGSIPAQYYPPMLFNPNAPSGQPQPLHQYDPSGGQQMQYPMYGAQPAYYPVYAYYPQPQFDPRQGPPGMQMYPPPPSAAYPSFPPQHAATWPQPQHPQPPPVQFQPQPQPQVQPMQGPIDAQRSTDSRLRLASRSSSNNQIPRASSVKLNPAANATDFPPLNGNRNNVGGSNGSLNGGIRTGTGVWGRDASPASLFGNAVASPMGVGVGVGPNNSSTGSLNTPGSGGNTGGTNANASANPRRFDATEGFGRPAPKSFGLYNPNTGTGPAALPAQVRSVQEGGLNPSPGGDSSAAPPVGAGDALAEQVAKLNVGDGVKEASGA
ncbi:hypothetical protein FRC08_002858 [Ceratobasidium sp. 394]|nr:hypothetical protein FRC08_002858 [Ceratobasidium sp. 394]